MRSGVARAAAKRTASIRDWSAASDMVRHGKPAGGWAALNFLNGARANIRKARRPGPCTGQKKGPPKWAEYPRKTLALKTDRGDGHRDRGTTQRL
jgi:hypothetical protein